MTGAGGGSAAGGVTAGGVTAGGVTAGGVAAGGREASGPERGAPMRFSVDAWDPSYGMSLETEEQLGESTARVETGVELPDGQWRAIDPDPAVALPPALLFVDGVRRIEARVWIDDDPLAGPATGRPRTPRRRCARPTPPAWSAAVRGRPT